MIKDLLQLGIVSHLVFLISPNSVDLKLEGVGPILDKLHVFSWEKKVLSKWYGPIARSAIFLVL